MSDYNVNALAKVKALSDLADRVNSKLAPMQTAIDNSFKSVSVSGNTISFFASTDGTGTAKATVDFPEEIFLDQATTGLVENFTWSAATYPGSTDPNLDGKTVLVLGIKGDKETNPTTKFSFVNLEKLIDTYTVASGDSAKILTINGYTITVNIDSSANNMLTVTNNGLMVDGSGKIDKVANATAGNVAILAADGGIADSGNAVATDAEITALLNEKFGTPA